MAQPFTHTDTDTTLSSPHASPTKVAATCIRPESSPATRQHGIPRPRAARARGCRWTARAGRGLGTAGENRTNGTSEGQTRARTALGARRTRRGRGARRQLEGEGRHSHGAGTGSRARSVGSGTGRGTGTGDVSAAAGTSGGARRTLTARHGQRFISLYQQDHAAGGSNHRTAGPKTPEAKSHRRKGYPKARNSNPNRAARGPPRGLPSASGPRMCDHVCDGCSPSRVHRD